MVVQHSVFRVLVLLLLFFQITDGSIRICPGHDPGIAAAGAGGHGRGRHDPC